MLKGVGPARIEPLHDLGAPAKGAKAHAAAQIFTERRHRAEDAVQLLETAWRHSRGHHLVEYQQGPGLVRQGAQPSEEPSLGRDTARRPLHRLDEDRGELAPVWPDQRLDRSEVVVAGAALLQTRIPRGALA